MIFGLVQNIGLASCESTFHGKSERRAHKAAKYGQIGGGVIQEGAFCRKIKIEEGQQRDLCESQSHSSGLQSLLSHLTA